MSSISEMQEQTSTIEKQWVENEQSEQDSQESDKEGIRPQRQRTSFSHLNRFVDLLWTYGQADLDVIIAVSGRKGMGKSSWAIQVARKYVREKLNKPFYVKNYVAYDNQDLRRMIWEKEQGDIIIADEAARFAMGEDWNKSENKELKKLMAQIRTKHLIILMCIPQFTWLDKKYRDDMISHWAWIPTRGHAYLFEPDDNPGEKDVWHIKRMQKLGYVNKFSGHERFERMAKKNPCYRYDIMFPPVPQETYAVYLKLRDKKAFESAAPDGLRKEAELHKIVAFNLFQSWIWVEQAVHDAKQGRINPEIIAEYVFADPVTHKRLVSKDTVYRWIQQLRLRVQKHERLAEEGVVVVDGVGSGGGVVEVNE